MFTGLIDHCVKVIKNDKSTHSLLICNPFSDLQKGESLAVNGVCLTVAQFDENCCSFDISPETLKVTSLGLLETDEKVHIERALSAHARLGGHFVMGHVDRMATIKTIAQQGDFFAMSVSGFSSSEKRFLVPKGSIALNGVSLTINAVEYDTIHLMLVPHTLLKTTFAQLQPGYCLNVEFDYFARIIAHQLTISGQLTDEISL